MRTCVFLPEGLEGRSKTYLLRIVLTAALKCITIKWLKTETPTYNCWIQRAWDIHHMEQIRYAKKCALPGSDTPNQVTKQTLNTCAIGTRTATP